MCIVIVVRVILRNIKVFKNLLCIYFMRNDVLWCFCFFYSYRKCSLKDTVILYFSWIGVYFKEMFSDWELRYEVGLRMLGLAVLGD